MKKRVADIVVDVLLENNINTCFSLVGGGAMHLNNAFELARDRIRTVYMHHESSCSMAAEAYTRYSARMAAVCVTAGPGGTNAINGVQGAWVDSIPMIVISGHPRYETTVPSMGLNLRSRGVQENDIISMVKPITKYATYVLEPNNIRVELEKAICIAQTGRRGPVWISIPLDVQGTLVDDDKLKRYDETCRKTMVSAEDLEKVCVYLKEAKRPCILSGSAIRTGDAYQEYVDFCKQVEIPIVGGAYQADINVNGDKLYYGMSGVDGPRCGNFILQSADVILVLGNSLGTAQTGFNVKGFAPNAKIIMVDAEPDASRVKDIKVVLHICCDLKQFLDKFCKKNNGLKIRASQSWIEHCDNLLSELPRYEMLERHGKFDSNERVPQLLFWKKIKELTGENVVFALGNSNAGTGMLQEGIDKNNQRVIVNYNCGSMGDDVPEAIGAAIASDEEVFCVTGDGSVMLNIQELATVKHHNLRIKLIVFNNNGYGAIRNTCSKFFDGVYTGCDDSSGIGFPDFSLLSKSFGIPYKKCESVGELEDCLNWCINQKQCFLEINETLDELYGPNIKSIMDKNGVFTTPALHMMSPLLNDADVERYMNV